MTAWQVCPVCQGHGVVPHGFFTVPAGQSFTSSSTGPDRCKACHGQGMVVAPRV